MSKDKTLIILTPAFPADESETHWIPFLQLMVKALKKTSPGLKIVVISFAYPTEEKAYSWNGVEVVSFNGSKKNKLERLIMWRKIWKKLREIRRTRNVIGLFSIWCDECAFVGKYFAKWHSMKHVVWICGQDALNTNRWVKRIRPKPSELAAMSPFLVNEFYKNHGVKPMHIIPNAIDPGLFEQPASNEKDIDIMAAGSLVSLKQYDHLVEVIATIKKSVPGVKAVHCGIGDEKDRIEAMMEKLDTTNNLQLLGNKPHEQVLQLMQRAKLFLHTSRFEGFGAVCLEALYAGAHVISYIYPLDHALDRWTVVKTKEEMADKALQILQDPHREHDPILVYTMDDSAKTLMTLFG